MESTSIMRRKHYKFPSTPRLDGITKALKDNAVYHWQLEHETEFEGDIASTGLLPTITFTATEKLHGENMAVAVAGDEIWAQGRNQVRTLLGDQNGMASFTKEHEGYFMLLVECLVQEHSINKATHTVVLDGEWAGGSIQRGNSAVSSTDKAMYLFQHFRVIEDATEDTTYLEYPPGIPIIAEVRLLSEFPEISQVVDFNNVSEAAEAIEALTLSIESSSPIAESVGHPENVGEGLYYTARYNGTLLRFKSKGEKHGGKPKTPKSLKNALTDAETLQLTALAEKLTPVWRITQAITETSATEMKHIGEVIKWVMADIAKEEQHILVAEAVELKQVQRFIVPILKQYYFDSLKGI